MTRLPAVLLATCFVVAAGEAEAAPTPVATEFNVEVTDEAGVARGFAVDLDGADYRVGMVAVCDRRTGAVTVNLFFGSFPVAQPVQAAVRTASGRIERFGAPVSTQYGAGSGFHSPEISDPADAERFIGSAFSAGALISNGYNSFWNRIPAAENDAARRVLAECAGR